MELDIDSLVSAIDSLTEKLNGVGIEIYHLNSAKTTLNNSVYRLANKDYEEC